MTQAGSAPRALNALQGGVRVGDVVERERLSLREGRAGDHGQGLRPPRFAIEGGALVGVLPVAHLRLEDELAGVDPGEPAAPHRVTARIVHRAQEVGDGRVVPGGVRERLRGELEPGRGADAPGPLPHFFHDSRVVAGIAHDRHRRMVFGRGPQHGGATDVDVLHRFFETAVRPGDRAFEGIEVDDQQIDRFDSVLAHDAVVDAAPAEQSTVHVRVKGLDPSRHDLRKAGQRGYLGDRDARRTQEAGRAPGRNQLHPQRSQGTGELLDSVLVRYADERSADACLSRHRRPSAAAPRGRGHAREASCAGYPD